MNPTNDTTFVWIRHVWRQFVLVWNNNVHFCNYNCNLKGGKINIALRGLTLLLRVFQHTPWKGYRQLDQLPRLSTRRAYGLVPTEAWQSAALLILPPYLSTGTWRVRVALIMSLTSCSWSESVLVLHQMHYLSEFVGGGSLKWYKWPSFRLRSYDLSHDPYTWSAWIATTSYIFSVKVE